MIYHVGNVTYAHNVLETTIKLCLFIYLLCHSVHPVELCIVFYEGNSISKLQI
jgi:hypothetical protein